MFLRKQIFHSYYEKVVVDDKTMPSNKKEKNTRIIKEIQRTKYNLFSLNNYQIF